MGLLSLISRLGKEDCGTPCQPIQCEFVCETCLDFKFNIRVTWFGINNGPDCAFCTLLNTSILKICHGPAECFFQITFNTDSVACVGIDLFGVVLGQNLIRVTLAGFLWRGVWQLTGPNVIQQLCGGGSITLPFFEQSEPFPSIVLCNAAGSTVLLEVIPAGGECGGPCTPPTVAFTSTPGDPTFDDMPTFEWTTTGTVGTTVLRLDGGDPIEPPIGQTFYTFGHLEPGPHTVVIEVDSNGCGTATDSYSWTIEPVPNCVTPTVTFTETPPATTTETSALFRWFTTGTVGLTLLRLDGGEPFAPISGDDSFVYQFLTPGVHTVEIEVLSQAGCGNDSEFYTWEILGPCTPPTVTFTQTPPATTTSTTATFVWTTTGTVSQVLVKIDGGPFTNPSGNNTHTFNNLPPGSHIVEVQVQSGACGNASVFHAWEITGPCVPPTVSFTQTPISNAGNNATFAWTTTGTVSQTTIQLDSNPPIVVSTNSHTFTNLSQGTHAVQVRVESQCGAAVINHFWTSGPPPTTVCEKFYQIFQILNGETGAEVEVTFSGVLSTGGVCPAPHPNYNLTWLFPHQNFNVSAPGCPDFDVASVIEAAACGSVTNQDANYFSYTGLNTNALRFRMCTTCQFTPITGGIIHGPAVFIEANIPPVTAGQTFPAYIMAISGEAAVNAFLDQILATGVGTVSFHSQHAEPVANNAFDFSQATASVRIFN